MDIDRIIKIEKIVKYSGEILILGAAMATGIWLGDALTEHTKNICPITSTCIESSNDKLFNIGIDHQKKEMLQDYEILGYKANVSFNKNYHDTVISLNEAEKETNSDGSISYIANDGTLLEVNGQVYEVTQNDEVGMAFESQIISDKYVEPIIITDELGNVSYSAPEGYQLKYVDGKLVAAKLVVEEQVLKLTKGE